MSLLDQETERSWYDSKDDRLFLVYYALPPGHNGNHWGVTPASIDRNIHSAINKPVVVYRKSPTNPFHTRQAGNFVHPTPEEAESEIGHYPKASEYFQWQEKYSIGRVRNVDKRPKGYAFTLEITDPEVKGVLKSDVNNVPGYTSPQIMFRGMDNNLSQTYEDWIISHIALVDVPAYGKEQAGLRAKCFGAEKECKITTRSASQENLGFCVKQATVDLVQTRLKSDAAETLRTLSANFDSSQTSPNSTANNITMSEQQNTDQNKASGETVTYNPTVTTPNNTQQLNTTSTENPEPLKPNDKEPQEESERISTEPKSLKESQMEETIANLKRQVKAQQKQLDDITAREKFARLSFLIPRDLFKSDESHRKEVEKTMTANISEDWLREYWDTKRQVISMKKIEEPLVVKSASLQNGHDVPDFSSSQNIAGPSNVQKQLELQRRILEGGVL